MTLQDWANVAVICGVFVGASALVFHAVTTRQGRLAHDYLTFREVGRDLSSAWRRYLQARHDDDLGRYEFGELVNQIEAACYLFNRGVLSRSMENYFNSVLVGHIIIIISDEKTLTWMREFVIEESTFEEIRRFVSKHNNLYRQLWSGGS